MRLLLCRLALVAAVTASGFFPAAGARASEKPAAGEGVTENWPQFRGPRGDGTSTASGAPKEWSETKNVRWKVPIHGRGWSSPVIWGPQIWMTTATEDGKKMSGVCVDRDTGAVVHDLLIYENEKPLFCHPLNSYASPTPVTENGRVYLHFGSYGTACLDSATGRTIWSRRDLPCDHFRGPGSSPILFGDLLIVHFDGFDLQYVAALEKGTGKTAWKTTRSNDFGGTDNGDFKKAYSTPLVIEAAGREQLISAGSRAAMSYDPRTGEELWRVRFESFSSTVRPLFGEGLIYINTGFGKADLLAVRPDGRDDVTDTHVIWTAKKGVPSKSSPVLLGGLIYMVHDAGVATCLDAGSGEEVWKERLDGEYSASVVATAEAVYFSSHEGETTVVRPGRKYERLALNRLDDGFMASPAIAGKALFLRTRTHLYRIEE
jgi:outer membrane protein assembly factor BamB